MDSPRSRTLQSHTRPEAHRPNRSPYELPSPDRLHTLRHRNRNGALMTTASNASTSGNHYTAAILAVLTGLLAAASTPVRSAEAPAAPETIVLKAAHLFDSTGTTLKDGATVVVRGDRIVSVGTGAAPPGARVIDLGDATLLPGFIDAHTHLTDESSDNWLADTVGGLRRSVAETA